MMNVLEKILEEIEERVNMVESIPVNEDNDFLDGEECYEDGRVQGRYEELVWCRNMIRSRMDNDLCTNTKNNMDEMVSIDSAIKILKNMQNPRIDYADMVGAPAFCYGKRYVFPEQEDYAIETALIALNEKKDRNIHRNNVVESNMDNKCSDCSRRKWYQEGYRDGKDTNAPGNDGWIPVGERLPEERDSIFAKFKGTDEWSNAMFEKTSDDVNITYELEDGTRKTGTSYTVDGVWKIEQKYRAKKRKVIAWKPLPEPYKGEEV